MGKRNNNIHPMTEMFISGDRYVLTRKEPFKVTIGKPAIDSLSPGGDYYCPVDIEWPYPGASHQEVVAFGVNELQALEMAFEAIRHVLVKPLPEGGAFPLKTVDYLVNIHSLPDDLDEALAEPGHELYETARLYQALVDSNQLLKVLQIDAYGQAWVEINLYEEGEVEHHTLKLDKGTYSEIVTEIYAVLA